LLSCSSTLPKTLNVDESYSGKEVIVPLNGSLKITLEANILSGYSWNEKPTINNEFVIKQSDYEYKDAIPAIPGIGAQVWTFVAVGKGEAMITNEYGGFVGGSQNIKNFTLFVVVK